MSATDFIREHWPELAQRIPAAAVPVPSVWNDETVCSHPEHWNPEWVHSRGGAAFAVDPSVPDGFFACGLQSRGSEYLFGLWREGSRRFAFYDQYLTAMGAGSKEAVAVRLRAALGRWEAGQSLVVFSGPWGHWRPAVEQFERAVQVEQAGGGFLVRRGDAEAGIPPHSPEPAARRKRRSGRSR